MSSTGYEVVEKVVVARAVAGVRARVPRGRVEQEFKRYLDQVYAARAAGTVTLGGQNIFIYRDGTPDWLDVEFCVGVTSPFSSVGAVEQLETPSGNVAMTTHVGDYGGLANANTAVVEWCRVHDRVRAGPSWEVYGHWNPDPAQCRTDVYYLLT